MRNLKILIFLGALFLAVFFPQTAFAGDEACTDPSYPACWPARVINQWACETCYSYDNRCSEDTSKLCETPSDCIGYGGTCDWFCLDTSYVGKCNVLDEYVPCNISSNSCNWTGLLQNCVWSGGTCSQPVSPTTLSCCGGGSAPTTGPAPTPGPTSTPAPTSTPTPSCTLSLTPATATVLISGTQVLTAGLSNITGGTVSNVTFISNKTDVATVNPASDTFSPYRTTATGVAPGTATITANAIMNGKVCDTDTTVITVPTPSCTVDLLPNSVSIAIGGTAATFTALVIPQNGIVTQVNFLSGNTVVVTVNPASDTSSPYNTMATWVSVGSTTVRAGVIMSGAERCFDTSTITVIPASAWWQVMDGDVFTGGSISSAIPSTALNPFFNLEGSGEFPGIVNYNSSADFGSGSVSSKGWLTSSPFSIGNKYSTSYFEKQIPADTIINTVTTTSFNSVEGEIAGDGFYWFRYDGSSGLDLSINSDINVGSKKVVLIVNNVDLYINKKIDLTDGQGFFMAMVGKDSGGNKGNIYVKPSVNGSADNIAELKGLYLADGSFYTGVGDKQLHIKGSVAGLDGISLQRDLNDNSLNPAEFIEYAPNQIILFPKVLKIKKINWREVAP